MNSKYESLDNFFITNEKTVNNFLAKTAFTVVPIYPLLVILTLLGITPHTSVLRLVLLSVFSFLLTIIFYISNKKNPSASYNKHILCFFTAFLIFLISIEQGLQVSMVYVVAPLFASLYFDEKFTLHTIIGGFFSIIFSYAIRAATIVDAYMRNPTRRIWGLAHATGGAIEYLIFTIICFFLSKEIKKLIINVFNHRQSVRKLQEQMIVGFSNIVEAKEGVNARNIKLTTEYLKLICYKLRENGLYTNFLTDSTIRLMTLAVPFHDIGKVAIPKEILNKTGKLTAEEYEIIKYHPLDSANFISQKLTVLNDAKLIKIAHEMALYHHERIDGTGYPFKIKGDSIPLSARIMAAADILDALLSKRAYKEAYSIDKALQIIKEIGGKSIDSDISQILLTCGDEINYIRNGGSLDYDFEQ